LEGFSALPKGWSHFEVLGKHNLLTINLTGQGLHDGKETVLRLEGKLPNTDPSDPDLPLVSSTVQIYTKFSKALRIGENEYSWHVDISDRLSGDESFPTVKSILTSPDFQLGSCSFGLTRYRRINFGPIANPFPVSSGEIRLDFTPTRLSISARYLRSGDLPELATLARILADLKVNNELLDHLGESH
jgi:hypothetical protein